MNFVTPSGFRDVLTDEAVLREQAAQAVQANMAAKGYLPVETPTLEVMDVLQAGGRLPGTPFKLFDARGDLLAMRPDVTPQIARMCATRLAGQPGPFRFRYMQRVFREAEGQTRAEPRETTQMGVELIGQAGAAADAEVVGLLAESLKLAGVADFKIALASVSVLRALLASCGAAPQWRQAVLDAYHTSNFVTLDELTAGDGAQGVPPVFAQAIGKLARIRGGRAAIAEVRALVAPLGCETGLDGLEQAFDLLEAAGLADSIQVDFSVMSSFDYYTGIVFEAYAPGLEARWAAAAATTTPSGHTAKAAPPPVSRSSSSAPWPPPRPPTSAPRRAPVNARCASPCRRARSTPIPSRAWRHAVWMSRGWTTPAASSSSATRAWSTSSCALPTPRLSWSSVRPIAASAARTRCSRRSPRWLSLPT